MSTEIAVLRALFRLSHRRAPATLSDLLACVREGERDVTSALASLARSQLVQRAGDTARLSLAGLAVAAAIAKLPRTTTRGRSATRAVAEARVEGRIFPMVRRGRAA